SLYTSVPFDSFTLSLHDALPISYAMYSQLLFFPNPRSSLSFGSFRRLSRRGRRSWNGHKCPGRRAAWEDSGSDRRNRLHRCYGRSEEHTSELQSRVDLVCRLLLE